MPHSRFSSSPSSSLEPALCHRRSSASHRASGLVRPGQRSINLKGERGLTLVEVAVASFLLCLMMVGVLQGMLQSRRMTEGSVRQATVASLVQGYIEQMKSISFVNLTTSPSVTPGTGTPTDWAAFFLTVKDSYQVDTKIYLAAGAAPVTLPAVSSLPTDASLRTETVDIDNTNSASDNTVLNMWVWINDMTGGNVTNCKSIVVVYEWRVRDGGIIHSYVDSIRTIRSSVETY